MSIPRDRLTSGRLCLYADEGSGVAGTTSTKDARSRIRDSLASTRRRRSTPNAVISSNLPLEGLVVADRLGRLNVWRRSLLLRQPLTVNFEVYHRTSTQPGCPTHPHPLSHLLNYHHAPIQDEQEVYGLLREAKGQRGVRAARQLAGKLCDGRVSVSSTRVGVLL